MKNPVNDKRIDFIRGLKRLTKMGELITISVNRNFFVHNPIIDPEANELLSDPYNREQIETALALLKKNEDGKNEQSVPLKHGTITLTLD